jgi:histone deacetylase complex regulatory component SIN3
MNPSGIDIDSVYGDQRVGRVVDHPVGEIISPRIVPPSNKYDILESHESFIVPFDNHPNQLGENSLIRNSSAPVAAASELNFPSHLSSQTFIEDTGSAPAAHAPSVDQPQIISQAPTIQHFLRPPYHQTSPPPTLPRAIKINAPINISTQHPHLGIPFHPSVNGVTNKELSAPGISSAPASSTQPGVLSPASPTNLNNNNGINGNIGVASLPSYLPQQQQHPQQYPLITPNQFPNSNNHPPYNYYLNMQQAQATSGHNQRPLAPSDAPPQLPPTPQPGGQYPQQKVALTDAFSYLDRVKTEFADQPEVYNRFLQVMREFKSNIIDANGVIGRVVSLFKGHRELILGFNAFLPRTHHIDPVVAENGLFSNSSAGVAQPTLPTPQPIYGISSQSYTPLNLPQQQSPAFDNNNFRQANNAAMPTVNYNNNNHNTNNNPSQTMMEEEEHISGPSRRTNNAQFSRAIAYVKKVKHRFANDPESYKTFLFALHSFHKDQRTVNEVYGQVTKLFRNHSDLLEEFMQFLPEGDSSRRSSVLPPIGQFSPPNLTPFNQPLAGGIAADNTPSSNSQQNLGNFNVGASKKRSMGHDGRRMKTADDSNNLTRSLQKTREEVEFFERVKNYIGNRTAYAEFLKCLNLFSQDILRQDELVKLVANFIGSNGELFSWFKKYIGYTGKLENISFDEVSPDEGTTRLSSRRRRELDFPREHSPGPHDIPELVLSECKRIHSYRLLPTGYRLPPATGRDDIGKEVLNDHLLCCASFESEDSSFVSSRKNLYEEALFRCEDERFELDLLIEGNRATVAILEPIMKRLESLPKEERDSFRLDSKLNGHSAMIYRRNLMRIYGDKVDQILEFLQKAPAVSIPIVLKRLAQKDEEWRQTQREWNTVWRTTHIKNYYKSLDHQGIDFKQNDRKNLSTRQVVIEAESKGSEPWTVKFEPSILNDVMLLIEVTIRSTSILTSLDRKACLDVFKLFKEDFFRQEAEPVVLYANNYIYCFIRLISMAAERLASMKAVALKCHNDRHFSKKVNLVATFLDLTDSSIQGDDAQNGGGDLYDTLLELTKNTLLGTLDPSIYEERIRYLFGNDAFPMYTFDRLVSIIVRCLQQNIINDNIAENLIRLFGTWKAGRSDDNSSGLRLSEWTARLACENILSTTKDSHLFRLVSDHSALTFQLISFVGSTFKDKLPRAEESWSAYVDEFVNQIDANPAYLSGGSPVFLGRSLRSAVERNPDGIANRLYIRYRLECKICVNTFRLLFVAGTEDILRKFKRQGIDLARPFSQISVNDARN